MSRWPFLILVLSIGLNVWLLTENQSLRKSSVVTSLEIDPQGPDSSRQLESAEELSFLRELLNRSLNFQSSSYLSSQATTLPWLSGDLADEKKKEIQRLSKKMRESSVDQSARLKAVEQLTEHEFQVFSRLSLLENGRETALNVVHRIEIEKTDRNVENVWGRIVSRMKVETLEALPAKKMISLQNGSTSILSFPCQVRSVSELDPKLVKMKLVTTRTTELSLTALGNWPQTLPLAVFCDQKEFNFEIGQGSPVLRYYAVDEAEGKTATRPARGKAGPERSWIKRSLEKELGFEIEDLDK